MSGNQEEVDGKPVDQIAKIAGPVGGLWVAYNDQGISGASFANLTTFARFREEHPYRTAGQPAAAEPIPHHLSESADHPSTPGNASDLAFPRRGPPPSHRPVGEGGLAPPAGETRTYADLARSIRRPNAVRAVGTALGARPIPVLIPCHRVLRSDGSLGGYAFG
ncbi:MAG: MGMT family protein, partial [Actinobacteria bacterium]|nr:MGMT family protein [Actinomycetota bacterium]